MKVQMEKRLAELREEFKSGQKLFAELDDNRAKLKDNLLRIAGAIQVLEETLAASAADEGDASNIAPLKTVDVGV